MVPAADRGRGILICLPGAGHRHGRGVCPEEGEPLNQGCLGPHLHASCILVHPKQHASHPMSAMFKALPHAAAQLSLAVIDMHEQCEQ